MPQVVSEEYDGVIYKGTRQEVDSIIQGIKNRGYARFPDIDELVFLPDYHEARKQDKDEGKSDDRINQEQTQKRLDVLDGPGFYRGFVSGLTNDDALGVQYLFERRFPELARTGGVAEDYYFYRKDDEGNTVLSYLDPVTDTVKDE